MRGMYELIMEESFQPEFGRPYQSEKVIQTMLSLMDAQLLAAEYNIKARGDTYFFYRETKK